MRTILVLNPKGGCGKSTIATNLAACYALRGRHVLLADFDVQASSLEWLAARDSQRAPIRGIAASDREFDLSDELDVVVMDAPAGTHGKDLKGFLRQARTLLVPVLPSPMDIRAAAHFVTELLAMGRVERDKIRVGLVANRVREQTLSYQSLEQFLAGLKLPVIAQLRDAQNYPRAAQQGLGVCELPLWQAQSDIEQWRELLAWLDSRKSLPAKN